jgi:hypothetical protein
LRQRDTGAVAVAAVEEAELANLDEVAALAMADALLGAVDREAVSVMERMLGARLPPPPSDIARFSFGVAIELFTPEAGT